MPQSCSVLAIRLRQNLRMLLRKRPVAQGFQQLTLANFVNLPYLFITPMMPVHQLFMLMLQKRLNTHHW
ncbi:hypothetical protein VU14_13120 [Aeromonas hydrophila]|nr:hypothetical protein VU14_13120 [Aeromonas hydrophila]